MTRDDILAVVRKHLAAILDGVDAASIDPRQPHLVGGAT